MQPRRLETLVGASNGASLGSEMMRHPSLEVLLLSHLKPYPRNARTHSKKQIQQIAASIQRFGFINPVLVDAESVILAGHGRIAAAKLLGMNAAPCLRIESMSAAEKRAYVIADNKLALNAGARPSRPCLALCTWPQSTPLG